MKTKHFLLAATALGLVITYACNSEKTSHSGDEKSESLIVTKEDSIKRGAYLVTIMGCNDCHSPKVFGPKGPELDTTRLLSGYPSDMPVTKLTKENKETLKNWVLMGPDLTSAVGPWGRSFAANITSDETGIGNWSEEQFMIALRKGKYKGMENGRDLLPPMPWQMFKAMSDGDIKAMFAYLKSTKPIKNVVPAPIAPTDL